jgi:hypothetical protein
MGKKTSRHGDRRIAQWSRNGVYVGRFVTVRSMS